MPRSRQSLSVSLLATALMLSACGDDQSRSPDLDVDAAFAALQDRGAHAMGVDQYTSTHQFDALPDGGRIELQRDVDDPEGVQAIRDHLREIREAFTRGDFSTPAFVHSREVPGTAVMATRSDMIEYVYADLPRGGEVRLITSDPAALEAIHAFMAFQRDDHRAGGMDHDMMNHGGMNHDMMNHGGMDHSGMDHSGMNHGQHMQQSGAGT
jgi:hypothetical protein